MIHAALIFALLFSINAYAQESICYGTTINGRI